MHAKAMHGRPYDGHSLEKAADNMKEIIEKPPESLMLDDGYKGHKVTQTKVFRTRQRRGVTQAIKRDLKHRSVIEPIIGHAKGDVLLRRNYLKGRKDDEMNAILSVFGFNFRQLIAVLAA